MFDKQKIHTVNMTKNKHNTTERQEKKEERDYIPTRWQLNKSLTEQQRNIHVERNLVFE